MGPETTTITPLANVAETKEATIKKEEKESKSKVVDPVEDEVFLSWCGFIVIKCIFSCILCCK